MTRILPAIILVNPQMGENIGATARAMVNFGLRDLRLVSPRDGWPNQAASANAVGAFDHLNPVQIFDSTAEAIQDCQTIYATTARHRDMRKKVFTPEQTAIDIHKDVGQKIKSAILFGGERAGLTNDDISLANHIISIPVNPDFASLNLGQSVLLMAYELLRAIDNTPAIDLPMGDSRPASNEELMGMINRLEEELDQHKFFQTEEMRPTMVNNIRNLFTRMEMSEQEVRTFHGIISALIGNKTK